MSAGFRAVEGRCAMSAATTPSHLKVLTFDSAPASDSCMARIQRLMTADPRAARDLAHIIECFLALNELPADDDRLSPNSRPTSAIGTKARTLAIDRPYYAAVIEQFIDKALEVD
jgi:hypothetical protein